MWEFAGKSFQSQLSLYRRADLGGEFQSDSKTDESLQSLRRAAFLCAVSTASGIATALQVAMGSEISTPLGNQKRLTRFTHTLTMENFNFHLHEHVVHSAPFSAQVNDGIEWHLDLHPNGFNEESEDYISYFLVLKSTSARPVLACHRLQIIGAAGVAGGSLFCDKPARFELGMGWGRKKFVELEELLRDENRYLPGNKLTLRCEVLYTVEPAEEASVPQEQAKGASGLFQ